MYTTSRLPITSVDLLSNLRIGSSAHRYAEPSLSINLRELILLEHESLSFGCVQDFFFVVKGRETIMEDTILINQVFRFGMVGRRCPFQYLQFDQGSPQLLLQSSKSSLDMDKGFDEG